MGRYYNSERIGEAANDIDETDTTTSSSSSASYNNLNIWTIMYASFHYYFYVYWKMGGNTLEVVSYVMRNYGRK